MGASEPECSLNQVSFFTGSTQYLKHLYTLVHIQSKFRILPLESLEHYSALNKYIIITVP